MAIAHREFDGDSCRSGLHPRSHSKLNARGHRVCQDCARERQVFAGVMHPVTDTWVAPSINTERRERWQQVAASLPDRIREMRLREGINSRHEVYRTLGDPLLYRPVRSGT